MNLRGAVKRKEEPMELDELFEAADVPARLDKAALEVDNVQ
jgi:hypothetical protein